MGNRIFIKIAMLYLIVGLISMGSFANAFAQNGTNNREISAQTAFGAAILKKGAKGGDVYELQGRLKHLGFYTGSVDGMFGQRTYLAVRLFQYEFGLKIDGAVGPKTKLKLWKSTKHWRPGTSTKAKETVLKRGARGGNVWDLQGRLKHIGFYTGKVDGHYGERTYRAVRLFQYEFGLKIDGVAGSKTLQKLRAATKNYTPAKPTKPKQTKAISVPKSSNGFSSSDMRLLAQAVFAEGRGEPYIGQVGIAAVILNRVESEKFPDTVSGVIFQPLAFEAVADGQIWMQPDEEAKKAVSDALNGWDPSSGALYYFNPARATSKWIWNRPQIKKIGKHIFTR